MSENVRFDEAAIALLNRVGGETLIAKMTALFVENAPARLSAVAEAVASDDHVRGAAAAHSLKSSAGQMGAIHLQHICENLEAALLEGDIASARSLLPQFRNELAAALDWLTQRRPS